MSKQTELRLSRWEERVGVKGGEQWEASRWLLEPTPDSLGGAV
jgi:hypothetical protein